MEPRALEKDGSDNPFVDVGNIRVTFVPAASRAKDKDWAGQDVLRFQAYRGEGSKLFPGPELPLGSPNESSRKLVELIEGLIVLCRQAGTVIGVGAGAIRR